MKVVIATTTFYNSTEDLRFHMACKTFNQSTLLGYPTIVVDGSPNDAVKRELERFAAVSLYPETLKGMENSRRLAFFYALNYLSLHHCGEGIVVWIEAEKHDFVRLIPEIVKPIIKDDIYIVMPRRSDASWKTYPVYQAESEKQANAVYVESTGRKDYDPFMGPVAFRAETLSEVLFNRAQHFGADDGGYLQHTLPLLLPSHRVATVTVDFKYPPEQRANEVARIKEMLPKRKRQQEVLSALYRKLGPISKCV